MTEADRRETSTDGALSRRRLDALLVDLDGVVTRTRALHVEAWKRAFDEYLRQRAEREGGPFRPFDVDREYPEYVDGRPRYEGVRTFLTSRGIELPEGTADDPPDAKTVRSLGNRKNRYYLSLLDSRGVGVYADARRLLQRAREAGFALAVVTSSRNGARVVRAADLAGLFDASVDGEDLAELQLPGKPRPDMFLEAARRLGVPAARCAVLEDAPAGVRAGRGGRFGLVVGVDRRGCGEDLRRAGADLVVADLDQLAPAAAGDAGEDPADSPEAAAAELSHMLDGRRPALFLDYDGTLTPIVDRPELAVLSPETRATLEALARAATVAVISGRERSEVARMVDVEGLYYAGSHGFQISGPHGFAMTHPEGRRVEPAVHAAARELRRELAGIEDCLVEDKRYAVAVHYRLVDDADFPAVEAAVHAALRHHPELRRAGGKKIFELRPKLDWDKGRAILWLMDALGLNENGVMPVYIGDDETDEDAFAAVADRGLGILVSEAPAETRARLRLADPRAVAELLRRLAGTIGGEESIV